MDFVLIFNIKPDVCKILKRIKKNQFNLIETNYCGTMRSNITFSLHRLTICNRCTSVIFLMILLNYTKMQTCNNNLGNYMYIEASVPRQNGDFAQLETPWLSYEAHCFSMWYHMRGSQIGKLKVIISSLLNWQHFSRICTNFYSCYPG